MQTDHSRTAVEEVRLHFDRLLSCVEVVSFDLFDTLFERNGLFSPKDLFYRLYSRRAHRLPLDSQDFVSARIRSEHIARVRAKTAGWDETTLDEIYKEMARLVHCEAEELREIMREELLCEQEALTPMRTGKVLFDAARSQGKAVVIVTDTYLPVDFIERLVKDNGYGGAIKTFVSSGHRKSKLNGSLFDVVLAELNCSPTRLLHIGDNRLSDVAVPSSRGIRTLLVPTVLHRFKWHHQLNDAPSGSLAMSAMLCAIGRRWRIPPEDSDRDAVLARIAVDHLAPLYLGFATWLVDRVRKGGYRQVYFAARDGAIIKRFFDLVASASGLQVDSRYLYISRATLYPSLSFTDPDMGKRVFAHNWDKVTVGEALKRMSLDRQDCGAVLTRCGLPHDKMPIDRLTGLKFSRFLDEIWPHFVDRSTQRFKLLAEYLEQEGLLSPEPAAFVDIGWHGSLQHCLSRLLAHLGVRKALDGLYVGTFARPDDGCSKQARGFLVEDDRPETISELIRCSPSLVELFHTAGHGSVLGYHRKDARLFPILQDNAFEAAQFQDIVEPMQNRAFEFVSDHVRQFTGYDMAPPDPDLLARVALRVIYAPTKREAEVFGKLMIATDLGGRMKSITGAAEWDMKEAQSDRLPDGTLPMWRAGFLALKRSSDV
jgi:FMN phosphatase YigB (HAD superfamily)